MKVPTDVAVDAVQIIMGVMEQADAAGPASQINLGPNVVAEMRDVAKRINDANPASHRQSVIG